ncbi:MAG: hypothetical protein KC442_00665 [Thermomicrobiales bacterium]|nr:hypothetical protein [Thermomicrobiales bacterium]
MDHMISRLGFQHVVRAATRRGLLRGVAAGLLAGRFFAGEPGDADARRCKKGKKRCGKRCRNLQTSKRHCGKCGKRCRGGSHCDKGVCCPAGEVNCRGECRRDCPTPVAHRPFPQHVAYPGAVNRLSRRSASQQQADVQTAYERWKRNYVIKAYPDAQGQPRYRIAWGKRGTSEFRQTISEGQGYGLIILAHMGGYDPDAQHLFDGVWRFSRDHPSRVDSRLMQWLVPTTPDDADSAFDGDCDIAYGLLLADAQWGSEGGIDYRAAALRVIDGIRESTIGPDSKLPMLGDFSTPNGSSYNQWTTRTSDYMLGNFRAFGRATGNAVWEQVVLACQGVVASLQAQHSPGTGLLPDFVEPVSATDHTPRPASPNFLEAPTDGDYFFNAARDPWRLGVDALINGDAVSAQQAGKIGAWANAATGGRPLKFHSGYHLDGQALRNSNYFDTCFVAPLGVAAMTIAGQQQWLDDSYAAVINDGSEDYFDDNVGLLCLLIMTGAFWDPTVSS